MFIFTFLVIGIKALFMKEILYMYLLNNKQKLSYETPLNIINT